MRLSEQQFNEMMKNGNCRILEDSGDRTSVPAANSKPAVCNELAKKNEVPTFDAQVSIHLCSRRHAITDWDDLCPKYVIDGLRYCRVLRNDSPREIPKPPDHEQVKIKKKEQETTIITINLI